MVTDNTIVKSEWTNSCLQSERKASHWTWINNDRSTDIYRNVSQIFHLTTVISESLCSKCVWSC